MIVTQEIRGLAAAGTFVPTHMTYDSDDPLAVTFTYTGSENAWVFARSLMADAMGEPGVTHGVGDVMFHVEQDTIAMTLGTQGLRLTVMYPLIGMEIFLTETMAIVPLDEEVVDFADDFSRWFEEQV